MASPQLYRVAFVSHGKVYEIHCARVVSSELWGFVEISGLVFDDAGAVVVDPTEEKLRDEFADVEVLHVPMQGVLRVEQVKKKGKSVIRDRESGEKVTPFPLSGPGRQGS